MTLTKNIMFILLVRKNNCNFKTLYKSITNHQIRYKFYTHKLIIN